MDITKSLFGFTTIVITLMSLIQSSQINPLVVNSLINDPQGTITHLFFMNLGQTILTPMYKYEATNKIYYLPSVEGLTITIPLTITLFITILVKRFKDKHNKKFLFKQQLVMSSLIFIVSAVLTMALGNYLYYTNALSIGYTEAQAKDLLISTVEQNALSSYLYIGNNVLAIIMIIRWFI